MSVVSSRSSVQQDSPSDVTTSQDVLQRLAAVCTQSGLEKLARDLVDLSSFIGSDMEAFELRFSEPLRHIGENEQTRIHAAARHLLRVDGKRLRPLSVIVASKVGRGFDNRVADLAIAVELVHIATLLHDDVVDVGDQRRGEPSARAIYGNAASIFAGDWVLIEALRRVQQASIPHVLDELLTTISQMIYAESVQLETRGRLDVTPNQWLQIVEGKTAALFSWAMAAGARAGGLGEEGVEALRAFGGHLGVAFQAVDDVLDLTGDASVTGKHLFADLREGKMTYPLLLAVDGDPSVTEVLREIVEQGQDLAREQLDPARLQHVLAALDKTRAVPRCMELARERLEEAYAALAVLPDGEAKDSLKTLANMAVSRKV